MEEQELHSKSLQTVTNKAQKQNNLKRANNNQIMIPNNQQGEAELTPPLGGQKIQEQGGLRKYSGKV